MFSLSACNRIYTRICLDRDEFYGLLVSEMSAVLVVFTSSSPKFAPSLVFFLRSKNKAMKVGIGMISRGEIGLIVAGVGVLAGVLTTDIYTSVIIMVAASTIITPLWLKAAYRNDLPESTPPQST